MGHEVTSSIRVTQAIEKVCNFKKIQAFDISLYLLIKGGDHYEYEYGFTWFWLI
jgi:hypothetical protein